MIKLIGFVAGLFLALPALAQTRHALVIGIDDYAHVEPLQKARNDAQAVAAALEPAGFRVTLLLDPDRRAMTRALGRFASRLAQGDEAVFYFAGHGIEVDGQNFLLPADIPEAAPGDEDFLIAEAIGVDHVLASLQRRGVRVSLLILDACRDNPFPRQGTRSLGATRGLGRVIAPEGSFVLFSAGAGQAALDRLGEDDADPNSVFTRALLPRLTQPGLDLRGMVQQVRSDVRRTAMSVGHDQFPAVYDQLDGDFRFVPAALQTEPTPAPPPPVFDPCAAAAMIWSNVEAAESQVALERFIDVYAETCPVFGALAEDRLAALIDEQEAEPDLAAMLADCNALAHPDILSFSELEASDLSHAEQLCRAVQDAAGDGRGPEAIQAAALLGRVLAAGGDHAGAARNYLLAAEAGIDFAMHNLGVMYERGQGLPQSNQEALRWFRAGAEAGTPASMSNLGLMYLNGIGVQQDDHAAQRWFRAAAEAGEPAGMTSLGVLYQTGRGVQQDDGEAARWYRAAAQAGNAAGMSNLGIMYHHGRGVQQDDREALRWIRAGAEAGNATGMNSLGVLYRDGHGVDQDDHEAVRWFRAATEAGDVDGMTSLGLMYHFGRGVGQDHDAAIRWWRLAAEGGNTAAMHNLAGVYEMGLGVPRDPDAAAEWILRGVARGETLVFETIAQRPRDVLRALQRRLHEAGHYGGRIDGIAGPATRAALRAYAQGS